MSDSLPVVAAASLPEAPEQAKEAVRSLLPELPAYIEEELRNLTNDRGLLGRNLTIEEKATACRVYAKTGSMIQAAEKIKGTPPLLYGHLERDPAFRKAFTLAKLSLGDRIQTTSVRRALEDGGVVDRMCQLKRFFPTVYRESQPQIAVGVSVNIAP